MKWLKYVKAGVAGLAAVVIVASAIVTGGAIDFQAIVAVLGALGVYALPNKDVA